jgi:hypothetical protein
VFIVPEESGDAFCEFAVDKMSVPPVWAPEMPIAAEGSTGYRYSDCK